MYKITLPNGTKVKYDFRKDQYGQCVIVGRLVITALAYFGTFLAFKHGLESGIVLQKKLTPQRLRTRLT